MTSAKLAFSGEIFGEISEKILLFDDGGQMFHVLVVLMELARRPGKSPLNAAGPGNPGRSEGGMPNGRAMRGEVARRIRSSSDSYKLILI